MKAENVVDPSDLETVYGILDLGDREYGLVDDRDLRRVEIWFDHQHDGSGCNNLVLDAFGRELDLEFCRSREVKPDEAEALRDALWSYKGQTFTRLFPSGMFEIYIGGRFEKTDSLEGIAALIDDA